MGIPGPAAYLSAHHVKAGVLVLLYHISYNGFGKAGPSAAGFKLINRTEQRLSGHNIHIKSFFKSTAILVRIRTLCISHLCHPVLNISEHFFQFGIARYRIILHFYEAGHISHIKSAFPDELVGVI